MNKIELKDHQKNQAVEQEQLLGFWIKSFGITRKDLELHPQINDLMLLIQWKKEFYKTGTAKHRKFFDNLWNWVYHNRLPLKAKQITTLGYYTEGNIRHRENIQAGRNTIKAQREYRRAQQAQ